MVDSGAMRQARNTLDSRGLLKPSAAVRETGIRVLQTIASYALLVGLWSFIIWQFDVPDYVLPTPWSVGQSLYEGLINIPIQEGLLSNRAFYLPLLETLRAAGIGFVLGVTLALTVALAMSWLPTIDSLLIPIITGFQSLPKIAVAPLFILWFGFGQMSKVLLVMVLVFFPVLVNSRAGLMGVSSGRLMMARSFNASRWRVQRLVRLPSALPSILTGLEIGIVYSLLGAVLAEFMGGSSGLGVRLLSFQYQQAVAPMFAVLIMFGLVGAGLFAIVRFARKKILYWESA